MRALLLLLLTACAEPVPADLLPEDALPPPVFALHADAAAVAPGGEVTFGVVLPVPPAPGQVDVRLVVTDGAAGPPICPPPLQGECLAIRGAYTLLGPFTASAGVGELTFTLPAGWSSDRLQAQAVIVRPTRAFLSNPLQLDVIEAPDPPAAINVLHITVRTGASQAASTDSNPLSLCLTATNCFPLGNPNFNDFEPGGLDTFVLEGVQLPRSAVNRVELRSANGSDDWAPTCVELRFDGEPVHCSALSGVNLGTGQLASWSDPLGLHVSCDTCADSTLTHGPMVGAVEPDRARLWVRADATRRVHVRVAPNAADLDTTTPSATWYADAGADFTHVAELTDLQPDTTYAYRVSTDAGDAEEGTLHTAPADGPTTMRLAFGSCARDDAQPIFGPIAAQQPDAFLFIGDNHYGNTDDLSDLRQFYRFALERPERAALARSTPTLAVWDDHDYVGNNTDGTAPGRDRALRAFSEYWANPSYGTTTTPGIFSTWRWGDIELFLLDDRYHRGLQDSVLGDAQTAWLQAALLASDATFKLLVSGSQWTHEGSEDSWAAFPEAQQELLAWIVEEGVEGVVFLSGDVHRSELRLVPGAPGGYGIPELVSSPLANSNSACTSSNDLLGCFDTGDYFVVLDLDTTLADPTLTATVRGVTGNLVQSWTILRSELSLRPPVAGLDADADGDGYSELAVGVPGASADGGAVLLLHGTPIGLSSARSASWDQDGPSVPGGVEAGDGFGSALAWGDFNGDGFADLAVGTPGEALGAVASAGSVMTLPGGPGGLTGVGSVFWDQGDDLSDLGETNDRLGAAVAVGDFDADGLDDLAIGVPGEDGHGSVHVLHGAPGGLDPASEQVWDQGTAGGPGSAESPDAFGAALAAGDFDGDGFDDLAIGHPGEDLSGVGGAGMITVMYGSFAGLTTSRTQGWNQDSTDVGGSPEVGDRFGASLAAGDLDGDGFDELIVGAPGDEVSGVLGAGLWIALPGTPGGLTGTGSTLWHTDVASLGLGTGDALATSLVVGDVDGDGFGDVIAGAPGRTVDGAADAGAVLVVPGGPAGPDVVGVWVVDQGPLPDVSPEAGDGFGGSVTVGDHDADGFGDLAVGAPGEAIGSVVAGMVSVIPGGPLGPDQAAGQRWHLDLDSVPGEVTAGDQLGGAVR
jgi:hypothetical protein